MRPSRVPTAFCGHCRPPFIIPSSRDPHLHPPAQGRPLFSGEWRPHHLHPPGQHRPHFTSWSFWTFGVSETSPSGPWSTPCSRDPSLALPRALETLKYSRDPHFHPPERSPLLHHPIQSKLPPPSPQAPETPPTFTAPSSGDPQIQERPHLHPLGHRRPHPAHVFAAPMQVQPLFLVSLKPLGLAQMPPENPVSAQPGGVFHPPTPGIGIK